MHNPGTRITVNTRHTMKNAQSRNTGNSELHSSLFVCVHCFLCSWIVHSSLCVLCSLLPVFLDCAFFIVCLVFTVICVPGLCILHCVSCVHCYPCSWIFLNVMFLDCAFFIAPSVLPNDILLFSKHITFRNIGITLGFSECSYCLFGL
jgi:hypothetical protein